MPRILGLNRRFKMEEERINEREDRVRDTIQSKEQMEKKKTLEKNEQSLRNWMIMPSITCNGILVMEFLFM